jgi:hypothetical protein
LKVIEEAKCAAEEELRREEERKRKEEEERLQKELEEQKRIAEEKARIEFERKETERLMFAKLLSEVSKLNLFVHKFCFITLLRINYKIE